MTVERARVIKASASASAGVSVSVGAGAGAAPRAKGTPARDESLARRLPRVVVDAHAEAERIVADAHAYAEQITTEASAKLAASAESAMREAREREIARVAAEVLVARSTEEQRAEREIDRTIELAVLLAERLIGVAIAVEPARVGALAVDALSETRGARQVRVEACPEDVAALNEVLASLGEGVATVEASSELARGSLIVHTELGRVDARLAPQLSRLAEALRELLRGNADEGGKGSSRA